MIYIYIYQFEELKFELKNILKYCSLYRFRNIILSNFIIYDNFIMQ